MSFPFFLINSIYSDKQQQTKAQKKENKLLCVLWLLEPRTYIDIIVIPLLPLNKYYGRVKEE